MPGKKISILLIIGYLLFVPLLSPIIAYDASCDLCGWCNPGTGTQNKPSDWDRCIRCVFPTVAPTLILMGKKPDVTPSQHYPSNPEVSKNWTVFGCLDTAPGGFVSQIYQIIVSISAGFALLAFIYGGFIVLTAGGDPQRVRSGKNIIMGAIFGTLLVIFSVFLLRLIGFEIIKIPGFG